MHGTLRVASPSWPGTPVEYVRPATEQSAFPEFCNLMATLSVEVPGRSGVDYHLDGVLVPVAGDPEGLGGIVEPEPVGD
jgi:hypothetical protein